jgi:hypothetical protein
MRWDDGDSEVKLLETATELHISLVTSGVDTPVATYQLGQIRSILDRHSGGTCTLRVQADDGLEMRFRCPAVLCRSLMRKLRSFQGANHEASLSDEDLLAGKFDGDGPIGTIRRPFVLAVELAK